MKDYCVPNPLMEHRLQDPENHFTKTWDVDNVNASEPQWKVVLIMEKPGGYFRLFIYHSISLLANKELLHSEGVTKKCTNYQWIRNIFANEQQ